MQITRKDVGYTIYSRLEEAFRTFISERLLNLFGNDWRSHVPIGIWNKVLEKLSLSSQEDIDHPLVLLDETDIPDLMEIICHRKGFPKFVSGETVTFDAFREVMAKLYELRTKIAHVKRSFSAIDLDLLTTIGETLLPLIGASETGLRETLDCIRTNPEKVILHIPPHFFIYEEDQKFPHPNNLPPADYDPDGGFIGRKTDLKKIANLVFGDLHRVWTITGAGGVGKTALAHQFCQNVLSKPEIPFDGVVWVSAKEERLSITGIEPIDPTVRNYEDLLDNILETFGWFDDLEKPLEVKKESVDVIVQAGQKGILLVVDNLETIRDARVIEFIKDFPPPSKVLITSRLGLGEVERRYHLKEMSRDDARTLLRTVAREKGADRLAELPDDVLSKYVDKMSRYPLAIKWVVGQVSLGKDIDLAVGGLTESSGDVARFCFEHIFESLLDEHARMVLFVLASHEKPISIGILSHISHLAKEDLETSLRELTIASLVIPSQHRSSDQIIETRYELLPLTRDYIYSRLQSRPDVNKFISSRMEMVQSLIEEADRAGRQYRYSLKHMGAQSEEEKVAATWAFTAYQKYQAGDYDGAIDGFKSAVQIAPRFPAAYRNWAMVENDAGFHKKADELMKKSTSLNPNDPALWFFWGNMQKRRQKLDRAYELLRKALDLSPGDAPILGALGELEKRRGHYSEAYDLLLKALKEGSYEGPLRRHEVVCHTSLADNLRRWAEHLRFDKNTKESLAKLREAYYFAEKAYNFARDDHRAEDTYREVSCGLAFQLKYIEGFDAARPYFEKAIKPNARRSNERKITQICCYSMVNQLIKIGKMGEAEKYYKIGRKALLPRSKYVDRYKELALELSEERDRGRLDRIVPGRGFGFLELEDGSGQSLFLHISQVVEDVSLADFENMEGRKFSFVIHKSDKGPEAVRARLVEDDKKVQQE
jgi:tetratricopeptide (TPR) repeat protein